MLTGVGLDFQLTWFTGLWLSVCANFVLTISSFATDLRCCAVRVVITLEVYITRCISRAAAVLIRDLIHYRYAVSIAA